MNDTIIIQNCVIYIDKYKPNFVSTFDKQQGGRNSFIEIAD
jgi:hypothetical protein